MQTDRLRLLWVAPFLLHPTRGGQQIRTLGIVKELHKRHEVHYASLVAPELREEGVSRAGEYCSHLHVIPHAVPHRSSVGVVPQLLANLFDDIPLTIRRHRSAALRDLVARLEREVTFDATVVDFLTSTANVPAMDAGVLFQHNVEAVILDRLVTHARTPVHRWYYAMQARRLAAFERRACRSARHVIAVSPVDAKMFRDRYGAERVSTVATGVDVDYFTRDASWAPEPTAAADIVFTGGMDWLPNLDGISLFAREILPRILQLRPSTTVTIVGRNPQPEILRLAETNPHIRVTGTVPDVRPYLWGSKVSIVPLRIGSGTRLKIYEAMAAGPAVVSTTIGAEGLAYRDGENITIADSPEQFARACADLITDDRRRSAQSSAAQSFVREHHSWAAISREFEGILRQV